MCEGGVMPAVDKAELANARVAGRQGKDKVSGVPGHSAASRTVLETGPPTARADGVVLLSTWVAPELVKYPFHPGQNHDARLSCFHSVFRNLDDVCLELHRHVCDLGI